MAGVNRSPTFLVQTQKQKNILAEFQKNQQHLEEQYQKNKPLSFAARTYQCTHPAKRRLGYKDADATLISPVMLGVCDGVSQLEEFGMDPSLLPRELLRACEEIAVGQLLPDVQGAGDVYSGPIALLKEAYEATESYGSTTVLLAALDNSTRIHGKCHPMIAVLSIGDCELLMMRRTRGKMSPLEAVFHTEMQRIDANVQTPLQLARVDGRIDDDFDESIALEVIEKGSAVHCISAYEGDIVVLGSDGLFDNLFLDEIVEVCNQLLKPSAQSSAALFDQLAQRLVRLAHAKAPENGEGKETPIGRGGKADDTSVVVGEVVEMTEAHREACEQIIRDKQWAGMLACGGAGTSRRHLSRSAVGVCSTCNYVDFDDDEGPRKHRPNQSRGHGGEYGEEDDNCTIL
mmetsp:Transcript_24433/g.44834  ORF Transcript_24433/g.44834 Transcript_24433/m.44834 type:complete len:402 (-) Transcript_24433:186-1391(-)